VSPATVTRACVYCGGEVRGLLATCQRVECVALGIARDVRLDRDIEAAEQ
jgi:hypothetical protein